MHALKEVLLQLPSLVNKGGIISFITYHSIEDRIVKRFIQNGCFDSEPLKDDFGKYKLPFKKSFKYLSPGLIEIRKNSRSRSAKLRSAIRI
jgi:16S rRNA (cytosine1402-N4)-methyltransferase